ncbi:cytochrome P450 [Coniophora puteana RWD-64-598 SS2]|uniref:Cytochrome P450 n=1 Tax=Coniophora puteana (strain RWD-64-598) TaxID=741705 RepID=A0A5M3N891_CONPW|nr:cytochrome P450 [Coniophora puteana RWD-64-598 SS2]EIW87324.1 cytochrome P450 [Coniophora puteana RWD-64-598 SS2]
MDFTRIPEQVMEQLENLDASKAALGAGGILALAVLVKNIAKQPNLSNIPAVGTTVPILSYLGALRMLKDAREVIMEGYIKYGGKPFRVALANHWEVILGPQYVDEFRNLPEHVFSFQEAVNDSTQIEYTLGPPIHHDPFHIPIIRSQLTRNLGNLYADIRDEIATAFNDELPLKGDEWLEVPALSMIQQVVCRTSNRIFVGLPLCRNHEWRALNIKHAIDVIKGAVVINLFPRFMAPLVAKFMTNVTACVDQAYKHLGPIIEERFRAIEEYGPDYPGKPVDMLSWLIDEAKGKQRDPRTMTLYILATNFAAIHTSSMSLTHALYSLAANPQYIKPLREEVETVVAAEGWTKNALAKMRKIDSFLKEEQRRYGIGVLSMGRKAMQDFTFSDGTFIPKGANVSIASVVAHYDEKSYKDASEFDPFRFSDIREGEGEGVKHQFVSTNAEYLPFGHGRHACPGRFFAANELKSMFAHIVMTYDVKLGEGEERPANFNLGSACSPNPTAKVWFRKRVD